MTVSISCRAHRRAAAFKMAIKDKAGDRLEWNVDIEVQLFYAMRGHKPVGVNRHFQMACILEKFRNSVQKDITSQQIWDHLETMYDMGALHESEILPFPNDELDFTLPEAEFGQLIKLEEKQRESKAKEERNKDVEREEKEKEREVTKSAKSTKSKHHHATDHSNDDKDAPTPKSSKVVTKEKHKELKEANSAENSPKRKRSVRGNHQEHGSNKSLSPALKEPTPKRRRT